MNALGWISVTPAVVITLVGRPSRRLLGSSVLRRRWRPDRSRNSRSTTQRSRYR
jgi:hypothetical protein